MLKLTDKIGAPKTFALPQVKYCCLNHRLLHHPEDHEEPWPIVVKYKPGVSSCFSWWTGADVSSQHFDGLVGLAWLVVVKYKPGMRWKRSCLSCWVGAGAIWHDLVDLGVDLGVASFWSFFCLLQSFIQPQCFWLCSLLRKKPGVSSCYLV